MTWMDSLSPSSSTRRHLGDARGAVFVEKLIVYLPLMMTFFGAWELAELGAAKLVVQRACAAAGRAAMVVLPDDPVFYDDEPVGSYDGQRRADIELAAGMILSAVPRLREDFVVDVSGAPSDTTGTIDVTVTAPYDCGLVSLVCGDDDSIELTAASTHQYHGAKYAYSSVSIGAGGGALVDAGGGGFRTSGWPNPSNNMPGAWPSGNAYCCKEGARKCPSGSHGFPGIPFGTDEAIACANKISAACGKGKLGDKAFTVVITDDGKCTVGVSGTAGSKPMNALKQCTNKMKDVVVAENPSPSVMSQWCTHATHVREAGNCAEAKIPGNLPPGSSPTGTITWWNGKNKPNDFAIPGASYGGLDVMAPCETCQANSANYTDNMCCTNGNGNGSGSGSGSGSGGTRRP
jgi:hypothetical protein